MVEVFPVSQAIEVSSAQENPGMANEAANHCCSDHQGSRPRTYRTFGHTVNGLLDATITEPSP